MMSCRFSILVFIALVVVGNWIFRRNESSALSPASVPELRPASPAEATAPSAAWSPVSSIPSAYPQPATPEPRSETSRAASQRDLENPLVSSYPPGVAQPRKAADSEPDVAADFDKVVLMFRDYRSLTGENPVGTNAEIMAAIIGGNPKGAKLGPPEGQAINENGELIDRWGTPYFFHQLTRDLIEIRSAGPDRRMWSDDDLIGS